MPSGQSSLLGHAVCIYSTSIVMPTRSVCIYHLYTYMYIYIYIHVYIQLFIRLVRLVALALYCLDSTQPLSCLGSSVVEQLQTKLSIEEQRKVH